MKRCPECRRDYYDETLLYCLDDGNALLEGPGSQEDRPTLRIKVDGSPEAKSLQGRSDKTAIPPAKNEKDTIRRKWLWPVVAAAILAAAGGSWLLTGGWGPSQSSKNAPSKAAYDSYLRGKVLVASENQADADNAIKILEQAVAESPEYAPAWAVLARAYNVKSFYFVSGEERKRMNVEAEVAIERALGIDPNLGEAHLARGLILWTPAKRFQHEQAAQAYKRALSLDPTLHEVHHQIALIYLHVGLFDKAHAEVDRALQINPGNILARFRYGVIALYQGRHEDAYEVFKTTPLQSNPSIHAFQTATVLFKLGRVKEAAEMIDLFLREYPKDEGGVGTSVRAMIFAKEGHAAEAQRSIARAEEIGRDFGHFHHTAYNIASAYAMLGKPDDAIRYLDMAADDGFPCYPLFANDDSFKSMRGDSRFVALLARMKQQWDRYNATL